MDISQVTLGLAFLAGLASFLSSCVFTLVIKTIDEVVDGETQTGLAP
jgi:cytochrome c biogenesis protein CcdA